MRKVKRTYLQWMRYIPCSRLGDRNVNERDNALVFMLSMRHFDIPKVRFLRGGLNQSMGKAN